MKVLFITPYVGSAYGGISKIVLELVSALGDSGLQVDLITTNADVFQKLEVPLNCWIQRENYRVQYFPCWHKNDLIFSKEMLLWFYKHVSEYSLVHTHTVFSPLVSCCHWICRSKKVPYIITPHGMLEPWAIGYKSYKKRVYFNLIEISNLSNSAFIQGTASTESDNIADLCFNLNIVFVPNGIKGPLLASNKEPDGLLVSQFPQLSGKKIILFLGRLDPKKGLDILAPAFAEAHKIFPNIHLLIAGPDNIGFQSTAEKYFVKAGVESSVTFSGMLTGDLKQSALTMADIYVAPSYSEGFSMSILEGMAAGLPCIITTSCNFPEAAKARAARVVPPAKEALSTALIELLQSPEEAKKMGERANSLIAENYTWQKVSYRLMEEYK